MKKISLTSYQIKLIGKIARDKILEPAETFQERFELDQWYKIEAKLRKAADELMDSYISRIKESRKNKL